MARGKHRKRAVAQRAKRQEAKREELTEDLAAMTALRQQAESDQQRAERLVSEIAQMRFELYRRQESDIVTLREEVRALSSELARHKAEKIQARHDHDRSHVLPGGIGADAFEKMIIEAEIAFRADHPDLAAAEIEAGGLDLLPEDSAFMTMDIGVDKAEQLTIEQVRILQRKRGFRKKGPLRAWAGDVADGKSDVTV